MKINEYVEKVLNISLSYYQKELIRLIDASPNGYFKEVVRKNPSHAIRQIADMYEKYQNETTVSA